MQMPLGIVFGETQTWQASSCDAFRRSCGNQWRRSVALSCQSQPLSGHRQCKRYFTFGASRDARGRRRCGVPIRACQAPLADIRPDRVAPLVRR